MIRLDFHLGTVLLCLLAFTGQLHFHFYHMLFHLCGAFRLAPLSKTIFLVQLFIWWLSMLAMKLEEWMPKLN
ncbi:hypothetical protein P3L10_028962 [Capsicum annuum]